jgi:hypothetical protein
LLCLAGLLAAALVVRVVGAWTDYPWCWYPDRDVVVHARNCINLKQPTLNPGEFIYPTGYIYLNALVYAAVGVAVAPFVGGVHGVADLYYERFGFLAAVTRVVGSLMSCASVLLVWYLAGVLSGPLAGWLAAVILTFAWLDVVCAHYPTADAPAALMLLATCAWGWRLYMGEGHWPDYLLGGLLAGAAAATKYPAGAGLLSLLVAHVLATAGPQPGPAAALQGRGALPTARPEAHSPARPGLWAGLGWLVGAAVLGFVALCPWVVLDWPTFSADLVYQWAYNHSGAEQAWQVRRFFCRPEAAGVGWPLNVVALLGVIVLAVRNWRAAAVLLSGPLAMYLSFAATSRFVVRWYEPIVPWMALGAGVALSWPAAAARGWRRAATVASALVVAALVAPALVWELRYDWTLLQPSSRRLATAWVREHIPPASRVALLQWAWAGPDVPEDRYRVEWCLPASLERWWAARCLGELLDGPLGRFLQRWAPAGWQKVRARQQKFWSRPLPSATPDLDLFLPPLPREADWVIVNDGFWDRVIAEAAPSCAGVPYRAGLIQYRRELEQLLATHFCLAARFGQPGLRDPPQGAWPYGSPPLAIYRRAVPARKLAAAREVNNRHAKEVADDTPDYASSGAPRGGRHAGGRGSQACHHGAG